MQYALQQKGASGRLTIIEGSDGPALVAIDTAESSAGATCTVQVEAARGDDDVLAAKPADAEGCSIRVVRSGPNIVMVMSSGRQYYWGLRAGFDGAYKHIS